MLLITNSFTVAIKGVISDLIGVLYLFCFHCTYDDRVDRRNSGVRSGIKPLTVKTEDTLYKIVRCNSSVNMNTSQTVSYTHLDVYKRQAWQSFMVVLVTL